MKFKLFYLFLMLSLILNAQNDFATINIYRSSSIKIGLEYHILIDGIEMASIKKNGLFEYKMFISNNVKIGFYYSSFIGEKSKISELNLNVIKGKSYYFEVFFKNFSSKSFIEELSAPLNQSKIKPDNIIRFSDIGKITINEKADTDWIYSKLIEYWKKNGLVDIEGIYERVSDGIEYKLAILNDNNNYKVIYISGAKGSSWKEGDIKATLLKTTQLGVFEINWRMLDKEKYKDVKIIFESPEVKFPSEKGDNSRDVYVKRYPLKN